MRSSHVADTGKQSELKLRKEKKKAEVLTYVGKTMANIKTRKKSNDIQIHDADKRLKELVML